MTANTITKGTFSRVTAALSLALVFCVRMPAQDITGTITGEVSDPSGAKIPGFSVAALNVNTGVTYRTKGTKAGVYVLPLVPAGEYQLTVDAANFKTFVRSGLTLTAEQRLRADVALEIGSVSERVRVTAEAPMVQSEQATVGSTFASDEFTRLPLGRNALGALLVVPGMTQGTRGSGGTEFVNGNVNGSRESMGNYQIDGVRGQDTEQGEVGTVPILEAIEEVVIQTESYSAESGHGATQVNVTTRGGTNEMHGTLFEYFGNNVLNASNFMSNLVGAARPIVRSNTFGGVVGGPVILPKLYNGRNRTFFSFTYEGGRGRGAGQNISTVPTSQMRNGDFSGLAVIYDPQTTSQQGSAYVRNPFPQNQIPASEIDPVASQLLAVGYPLPNRPGLANDYVYTGSTVGDSDQIQLRIDHNQSDKSRFTARYTHRASSGVNLMVFPGPAGAGSNSTNLNSQNPWGTISAEHTYVFRPNLLNTFRFGYGTIWNGKTGPGTDAGWPAKLGIANTPGDKFPLVAIAGLTTIGGANLSNDRNAGGNPSFSDSLLWIRNRHTIRFGGEYQMLRSDTYQPSTSGGSFTFGTLATMNLSTKQQGNGFASFLVGLPDSSNVNYYLYGNTANTFELSWPYYEAYLQDDIRVSKNLSVNVGMRWEMTGGRTEAHDWQSSFDFATGRLRYAGVNGYPTSLFDASWKGFQPRIGFAYTPFSRTVVRAGYGIYVLPQNTIGGTPDTSGPWNQTVTYTAATTGVSFPVTLHNAFPAYNVNATPSAVTGGSYVPRDFTPPYSQEWSLDVQRQLTGRTAIDLGYTGTKGNHLQMNYQLNQVPPEYLGVGSAQAHRPYPQFGSIAASYNPVGNSIYHALQAKLEHRFSGGFSGRFAYTFSKSIDDSSGILGYRTWGSGALLVQNNDNLHLERSPSGFDMTHSLSGFLSYELPVGQGRRWISHGGVLNALAGGWNLSIVSGLYSGRPLTMGDVTNQTGSLDGGVRPNRLSNGVLAGNQRSIYRWFDASAFLAPLPFTFGNDSRTEPQLRAPGAFNFNTMLGKEFRLDEKRKLELRAEGNNALNHFNPGVPNTTIGSPAVGTITTGNAARSITAVLKLTF